MILGNPQQRIGHPVVARDARLREDDSLRKGAAHGLDHATRHLVLRAGDVDRQPGILRRVHVLDGDLAGRLLDLDVGHHRGTDPGPGRERVAPRPVTTSAFDSFDAATFDCHFAALVAPSSRSIQRWSSICASRNATGSMFAAWANSSTICSKAKQHWEIAGARSGVRLRMLGGTCPVTRHAAMFGRVLIAWAGRDDTGPRRT